MNLSFTPILGSDKPLLFALYASTRANEMAIVPWNEEQKLAFLQHQFQSQHNFYTEKYPQGKFQVIKLDEEKIGRLYLAELDDEIRIVDLTILPEYLKLDIETKIVSDIIKNAKKAVRIYLESFNQSINVYENLGFQIISDEGIYQLWQYQANNELKANASANKK